MTTLLEGRPTARLGGLPWAEVVAATVILGASTILTFNLALAGAGSAVAPDAGALPASDWTTFGTILLRNSAVALGLFSGAVTLGVTTGVFMLLVGGMLGWSMAVSVAALGAAETLVRSWAYTPLEVAGFALAGAAGLIPLFGLARGAAAGVPRRMGEHLSRALRLLAVALAVLVTAAALETLSIGWTAARLGTS